MTHLLNSSNSSSLPTAFLKNIKKIAHKLGLDIEVIQPDLKQSNDYLKKWLAKEYYGDMEYMVNHQDLRANPNQLHAKTKTIIIVKLNYYTEAFKNAWDVISNSKKAYISRYALGRDYHKVLKGRLKKLQKQMELMGGRIFVDSAPVMEKPIGEQAGLGWIGKHTNLVNKKTGSYFFLGEIYTELDIKIKPNRAKNHCGTCTKCIDICPTHAIINPYQLDARKCIAYLTIEHKGVIAKKYHQAIGNRIFGCDDCQLICPFNRFAKISAEIDFEARNRLEDIRLLTLWSWDEATYLKKTEGMALRRVGYSNFMRNIAIGLGNIQAQKKEKKQIIIALKEKYNEMNNTVQTHIFWAVERLES